MDLNKVPPPSLGSPDIVFIHFLGFENAISMRFGVVGADRNWGRGSGANSRHVPPKTLGFRV